MSVSLLSTEGDDGRRPETEARPPHRLQSAVQQVPPPHLDVGLYVSIHVLPSELSQDGVQVELHATETGLTGSKGDTEELVSSNSHRAEIWSQSCCCE